MISTAGRLTRGALSLRGKILAWMNTGHAAMRHNRRSFRARVLWLMVLLILPTAGMADAPPAADFTLKTTTGKNLRLEDYRGGVVAITFWKSRCRACGRELSALNRLYKQYSPQGFTVLSIYADPDVDKIAADAQELGLTFPVLLDPRAGVAQLYKIEVMPTTVLVDRDGRMRQRSAGGTDDDAAYEPQVRVLLKEWQ